MTSQVMSEGAEAATTPERDAASRRLERPLTVLFIMRNLTGYLRFFASSLELLVERGHMIRLLIEDDRHTHVEQAWLDRMRANPNFTAEVADHFGPSRWSRSGREIRRSLNYVRYLYPEFAAWPVYRWRSDKRSSPFIKRLTAPRWMRAPLMLGLLRRSLSALDRAVPRSPLPGTYIDEVQPDVVALCDYGIAGSLHSTYVEAARARGIPAAICVASWDNLSSRQLIRAEPDALVVWNEQQVEEAVQIHEIPHERIVVTGAQCFDHWFSWTPRPREEFCTRVGLDPSERFVLWVGCALTPAQRTEPQFVVDWLAALRESDDESLRRVGVLLRPHPNRLRQWHAVDFSAFDNVAVWPRGRMTMPTDAEQRGDYFDSIFHSAAVVGVNTSAMIEAAIVGRPVLGIRPDEFLTSHVGTVHFSYLAEEEGGFVRAAGSIPQHLVQISAILRSGDEELAARSEAFVRRFVRPQGLERPASPIFVETLEKLAITRPAPWRPPLWVGPARAGVAAFLLARLGVRRAPRLMRRARMSARYRSGLAVTAIASHARRGR